MGNVGAGWVTSQNQDRQEKYQYNVRYVDHNTLMEESEEELKSLLMKVKEKSERASLKLNIKKQQQKQKLRSWHPTPLLLGK